MPAIRLPSLDNSILQMPVEKQIAAMMDMLMRYRRELEYLLNGRLDEDNGLVSADVVITNTLVTNTLYAEYGRIANLTVSELNTAWKKITNYLASDTSDVHYLHMYEQNAKWIDAHTDGSATVQETDYASNPLYWVDETHKGMTTTENAFPVLTYVYTEYVKREISFITINGVDIPVELIGAGTGTGNNGKGFIYKDAANDLHIGIYHATTGVPIEFLISDDGPRKAGGTGDTQIRNIKYTANGAAPVPADYADLDDGDQIIGGFSEVDIQNVTGAVTLVTNTSGVPAPAYVRCTGSSAYNVTLHAATEAGIVKRFKNRGSATVTLVGTVDGGTNYTLTAGSFCVLVTNGTDWDRIG